MPIERLGPKSGDLEPPSRWTPDVKPIKNIMGRIRLPESYIVTVVCPKCGGRGGDGDSYEKNKQGVKIKRGKKCYYCKGTGTVKARTEPN